MREIVSCVLLLLGAAFMLVASLGIFRMPELFTRMQAATKSSSLGAGLMLLGVVACFGDVGITTRALATIVFIFLTAPVPAHMLGRVAYLLGVPLWEGTIVNELRGKYNLEKKTLSSTQLSSWDEQTR